MARCEQGYMCRSCGEEVAEIVDSDLYLSYVIGEIDSSRLMNWPDCHIRCNSVQAQFIVDPEFEAIAVAGPFDKRLMDAAEVASRERLVTAGWRRLLELQANRDAPVPLSDYPLEEVKCRTKLADRPPRTTAPPRP